MPAPWIVFLANEVARQHNLRRRQFLDTMAVPVLQYLEALGAAKMVPPTTIRVNFYWEGGKNK